MTHPIALSLPALSDPGYLAGLGGLLALALAGWSILRNRKRTGSSRASTPAVWIAALAALNCTVYSADTSWRFAADYLNVAGTAERAMLFSAAELALFATAVMARQNLKSQGAPGVPGGLVWVITGVQVIPAYAESGAVGGTVRAFVGPVMAAMLWHLAMGIELRLHKPDAASQGLLATLGREARERLLSRLGIAARNRNAAQITQERALTRAVALASRLADMPETKRGQGRRRRTTRRLQSALTRSGVGTDPHQRRALLEQLAARKHAAALATVTLPSPWTPPSRRQDEHHGDRSPLAPSPATRVTVAEQESQWLSAVPDGGRPRSSASSFGDRPDAAEGTESNGDRPATVPDSEGDRAREAGSSLPGGSNEAAIGDRDITVPGTVEADSDEGTGAGNAPEAAAQGAIAASPAAVPNHDGDRERPATDTGTEPNGDRPHTVPVRRKPQPRAPRNRPRGGQAKRTRKGARLSVEEMVERVRPHVPALLERDGNESLTRVQLREILRAEDLQGGRNERLTPVLQQLRDEAGTTTTRSTTR
ncbi:hypothetical protein ACFYN0_00995 [Streptomyces sp. NPDC006704]|uniref:hypothetical protein n=1 Tax=Streptomyces sp. NPDC006704 TaxID=3364760 RepID=UPI0036800BEA